MSFQDAEQISGLCFDWMFVHIVSLSNVSKVSKASKASNVSKVSKVPRFRSVGCTKIVRGSSKRNRLISKGHGHRFA